MEPKTTRMPNGQNVIVEDYVKVLEAFQLDYRQFDIYYQVGEPEPVQGWILHLSVVWTKIPELLETVVPVLLETGVPFKIVQNKHHADMVTLGNLGLQLLGKIVSIYPQDDTVALEVANRLLETTKGFHGCSIPTDFHLDGIVYTRYGAIRPKLFLDPTGRIEKYIHDASGNLVKDEYFIPARLPQGVDWPFGSIRDPMPELENSFLNNNYKIMATLKADAKGRVMKALRFKGIVPQWVVIKEAKFGVCLDDAERDVRDRLQYQYNVMRELQGKLSLPKVFDYFQEGKDSYLVMEYIKGKDFATVIQETYGLDCWWSLTDKDRNKLIDYFLQLLDIVEALHTEGFVHRDLTSANFMVNRKNVLVPIDMELIYSTSSHTPDPPFTLGTPGFISPEQQAVLTPTIQQDIYALGAVMIHIFTNLSPSKFEQQDPELWQKLDFFLKHESLSRLVARCLSSDPEDRPSLSEIRQAITHFRDEAKPGKDVPPFSTEQIKDLAWQLTRCFAEPIMVLPGQAWHSNAVRGDEGLINQQVGVTTDFGLYAGVAGVMYAVAEARARADIKIPSVDDAYQRALDYLHGYFLNAVPNVVPGLYHGGAGIAMAFQRGIAAGILDRSYTGWMQKCLDLDLHGKLDIEHGAAGQGLAILKCKEQLSKDFVGQRLQHCAQMIVESQEPDGSWASPTLDGQPAFKYSGFSKGCAGNCFFLLEYYSLSPGKSLQTAIVRGLSWLRKQAKKDKRGIYWRVHDRAKSSNPWFSDGSAGIAMCFTKAYQLLGDPAYREMAEKALGAVPAPLVYHDFTYAHGVLGLGQAYLAAAETFENREWEERAQYMAQMMLHVHRGTPESDLCYWQMERGKNPTADLMVGNGGILMHLLQHLDREISLF